MAVPTTITPAAIVLPPLKWQASPNFSSRRGTTIDLLVYHETAGSYRSAINWLCTPTIYDSHGRVISGPDASAMGVLNELGTEFTQLVLMRDKAWAQAAFNARAIGVEHANITPKGYATEHQLRVSARCFAWLALHNGIPIRISRGGHGPGICRHSDLGSAGGGHTQCGMNDADFLTWMNMIEHEHIRGGFKKSWAR